MTLGEKIQKLRKQRGLSQEALAEKVTVTRQTISKWELGQSLPDLDFIAQLSNIFNVSSDYLIKDEMTEPNELPYPLASLPALFRSAALRKAMDGCHCDRQCADLSIGCGLGDSSWETRPGW